MILYQLLEIEMDLTQSLIIHQVEEDKPVEIKFYENTHKYNILIKTAI